MSIIVSAITLAIMLFGAEAAAHLLGLGRTYNETVIDFAVPHQMPVTDSPYLPISTPTRSESEWAASLGYNDLGYRSLYPLTIEKPEGTRRILLLGDSFTVGWDQPFDEIFASLLQSRFPSPAFPVEVINAGYRNGFSPDAYYAYMLREGLALEPDIVVANIFISNDVTDMGSNVWRDVDARGAPTSLFTTRHFRDYNGDMVNPERFWYYRLPILRNSALFTGIGAIITPDIEPQITEFDAYEDRYFASLQALQSLAEDEGFELYVLVFSTEGFPPDGPNYAEYGAPTVELLGEDIALDLTDKYHLDDILPGDGHWIWKGHQKHALYLYEFIQPSLRAWNPEQPGPLTEDELEPLRDIPFEGSAVCGAFQSHWGLHHLLPARYPECAPYLPGGVTVACLDDEGEWRKTNVEDERIADGFFRVSVWQSGICGIFLTGLD